MVKHKLWNHKLFDSIKKPILTEKTTKFGSSYTFEVDAQLTKQQIKAILEHYYNKPIKSITTLRKSQNTKHAQICFYEQTK